MKQIDWGRQIQNLSIPNAKLEDLTLEFGKFNTNSYTTDLTVSATATEFARADAIKSYVDELVDGSLKAPEAYDPTTTSNYPTTYGGDPIQAGDSFRITAAGTMGGRTVNVEDLLIALVDWAGATTDADWMVAESNRDQATETTLWVAKIATQALTDAWTNDTDYITPLKLATYITDLNINNIYDADGALTGNRFVNTGANSLTFDGTSSFRINMKGTNTGLIQASSWQVLMRMGTTGMGSTYTSIDLRPDRMIVTDTENLKWLTYIADYSTNGVLDPRWIPDYEAVTNAITSATIGAGNGLVLNGSDIDVVPADASLTVNADDMQVNIGNTNWTSLEVSATGLELVANITWERTFTVGTGNNFDIVADMNLSTLSVSPDGTVPLAIATVDYVDTASSQPIKESHTLTAGEITAGSFTVSQTVIADSMDFVFNGNVEDEGDEYTVSGTTVTLVTPADWVAGDIIKLKYRY